MIIFRKKTNNLVGTGVLLMLALMFLSACGPSTVKQLEQQRNAKQLTPHEVLKLVDSNTLFLQSREENSYYYYDHSGTLFGQDIDNNKDTGKWDVTDSGEVCMRMEWWWHGDLRCFQVYGDGEKYYLADSAGVISSTAKYFEGDSKNLYHDINKKERKSYRHSIRQDQNQSSEPENMTTSSQPTVRDERTIIEEKRPGGATESELKSTVRWMARDCPGCNLGGTDLKKADLIGAKLQGANLSGANLSMANLRRADLQGANLENTNLSYANLPGADLRNCNLKHANLKGANLIQADLSGADLTGADFTNALLEGTKGMTR